MRRSTPRDTLCRVIPAQDLCRALLPALSPEAARRLADELVELIADSASPEASVRWTPSGGVRAGRMMLERSSRTAAERVASALGLRWAPECERLLQAVERLRLPLIVGWDVGGDSPALKLYANASDAAQSLREELLTALDSAGLGQAEVIGLNVERARVVRKLYHQRRSFAALGVSGVPEALASFAPAAGWVRSSDVFGATTTTRAVFVAVPPDGQRRADELLQDLTGLAFGELSRAMPFAPGAVRQIGWSPDGSVTVYAKPVGAAPPVELRPVAIFATDDAEVGLHVEPNELSPRAFTRSDRHALSFRARAGHSDAQALTTLGAWARQRVADAERTGQPRDWSSPPAPWRRVEDEP